MQKVMIMLPCVFMKEKNYPLQFSEISICAGYTRTLEEVPGCFDAANDRQNFKMYMVIFISFVPVEFVSAPHAIFNHISYGTPL